MVCPLGVAGGTMAMIREQRVDRIAGNPAPASENAHGNKDAKNASAANAAHAQPKWIRPLGSYDRRERCEFQVARFG